MGLLNKLLSFGRRDRGARARRHPSRRAAAPSRPAALRFETMEPRYVLSACPVPVIELGAVYTELTTTGPDTEGDRFEITWRGGGNGTQLTRLVINGDQDGNGLDDGDVFFDPVPGGPGVGAAFPFAILPGSDISAAQIINLQVIDGGHTLILDIVGWDPGEKLIFTIDVDELDDAPNSLAEGAEFENSVLTATFVDMHGHHQDVTVSAIFKDNYDHLIPAGLSLPLDSHFPPGEGTSVRTAGTGLVREQPFKPFTISGTVYADNNLNNAIDGGEVGISGVTVHLHRFDEDTGQYVDTGLRDVTDANGFYSFTHDCPGRYRIVEEQPSGYVSVGSSPGTGATSTSPNIISDIVVRGGESHPRNNFAEVIPAQLSGHVFHDRDDDGVRDAAEEGIGGVTLKIRRTNNDGLLQPDVFVHTQSAGDVGYWQALNLLPGQYVVTEFQPSGWIDGRESPGSAGGLVGPNDTIHSIQLTAGLAGVNYDFGELRGASLAGRVHADTNGNCMLDPGEATLGGVLVELLNEQGSVVASTHTAANGRYKFDGLRPGTYSVREYTPSGYFDGDDHAGTAGGTAHNPGDLISGIRLVSGQDATDYDFCEHPPGSLSGYVFRDGPPIIVANGSALDPAAVRSFRDGLRTPDDAPLAGVLITLLNGEGQVVGTTFTDGNGFYRFTNLAPGEYTVLQSQPAGFIDGWDHPGSGGGIAANYHNEGHPDLVGLAHNHDAIARVRVEAGRESVNNNFSEIATAPLPPNIEVPPEVLTLPPPPAPLLLGPGPAVILPPAAFVQPSVYEVYGGGAAPMPGTSWHLSIINAGQPRASSETMDAVVRVAERLDAFRRGELTEAAWQLANPQAAQPTEYIFGLADGIPVTGDFNGDGVTDIGVFRRGEWFLDLNGNGVWDEGDLWCQLGTEHDQPVTGDWDGDGKTDIGIFGPEWPNDPRAVMSEPGLPDRDNQVSGAKKNLPPREWEATAGQRLMKRTSLGQPRTDVIDHVFYYGSTGDIGIAGDWNGDGITTIGVFNGGMWILDDNGDGRWLPGESMFEYGKAGDIPVVGDWNGDGIKDVGIFRNGQFTLDTNGNRTLDADDETRTLGQAGDLPAVGDWDGDGSDDVGIYRPTAKPNRLTVRPE